MEISIKEACHENWNNMTPNEQGAFCSKCVKTVIDFTDKSIDEIKSFFAGHKQESTCGRFEDKQLSALSFDAFFERFRNFEFTKRFAVILFFTFGFYLFGTSTALAQSDSLIKSDTATKQPEPTALVNVGTYTSIPVALFDGKITTTGPVSIIDVQPKFDWAKITTTGTVSIIETQPKFDWSKLTVTPIALFNEPVKKPVRPAPLKRESVYRRRD